MTIELYQTYQYHACDLNANLHSINRSKKQNYDLTLKI